MVRWLWWPVAGSEPLSVLRPGDLLGFLVAGSKFHGNIEQPPPWAALFDDALHERMKPPRVGGLVRLAAAEQLPS